MYQSPSFASSVGSVNIRRQGLEGYGGLGGLASSPYGGGNSTGGRDAAWSNDGYSGSFASRSFSKGDLSRPQSPYRDVLDNGSFHGSILEQQAHQTPNGVDPRNNQPQQQYLPTFLMNTVRDSPDMRNSGRGLLSRSGGSSGWGYSARNRSRSRSPTAHHRRTGSSQSDEYGMEGYGSPSSPRSGRLQMSMSMEDAPPIAVLDEMPMGVTSMSRAPVRSGISSGLQEQNQMGMGMGGRTSMFSGGLVSENRPQAAFTNKVRILGFPPDKVNEVYYQFATYGEIVNTIYENGSNFLVIEYARGESCVKALRMDQTMLWDANMVVVTRITEPKFDSWREQESQPVSKPTSPARKVLDTFSIPQVPTEGFNKADSAVSSLSGDYNQEKLQGLNVGNKRTHVSTLERENVVVKKPRYLDDDTNVPSINPPSLWSKLLNVVFGW